MTLDRVGAFAGPDLAIFDTVRQRAGQRTLIGAGGIRDDRDLVAAAAAGAAAWLVASALHDLRVSPVTAVPS
jgi:phosphoribosylformimino-5-aminoimidazole carboxamide ribotide isomerase